MKEVDKIKVKKVVEKVLGIKGGEVKKFTGETVCQPVEEEIRQRLQTVLDDYCDGSVSVCQVMGILFDMQINLKMNH